MSIDNLNSIKLLCIGDMCTDFQTQWLEQSMDFGEKFENGEINRTALAESLKQGSYNSLYK